MWSVRILSGPHTGQIFDLKLGKNLFGRGANCDFKIQSVGISKEHCEIHVYKDKSMIVDLKSSNGTFVNGVKIQNSMIKLGDKLSLFDVIMDVIPTPEIRPKAERVRPEAAPVPVSVTPPLLTSPQMMVPHQGQMPAQMQSPQMMQSYGFDGANALQQQMYSQSEAQAAPQAAVEVQLTLQQKLENYIENIMMPAVYKLAILLPFKQVLLGFVLVYILSVTLLSLFPLNTIVKESNYIEASRRAKSVARALARFNEQALMAGQLGNLNVSEALKEDGVKEAFIIQQADGAIIAPPEKAGREAAKPFIVQARRENRAATGMIDSNTLGASHPLGIYDANTGESTIKYHTVVYYDVSSLNVEESRVISLFMQTLIISSLLGLVLYFFFVRLIQYPLKTLNAQIDVALREKTDRTEIPFDYPEFQQVVANVNLLLNRMWNGNSDDASSGPKQNRDVEFSNMIEMLTQPAIAIAGTGLVVAINKQFEQLSQMPKESLVQQHYNTITDNALLQNIESLIARSTASPYEQHSDVIPFAQFECCISIQASLGAEGAPEYFFITLVKKESE